MDHDKYAHHFLYNAAKYGHESVFRSLVEQYGGINAPLQKTTAFHMACKSGNLKSIRLALELGGNVTITDENVYKPLHALVIGGEDENKIVGLNIQLLVKNGASIDDNLPNGQTALSLAKYQCDGSSHAYGTRSQYSRRTGKVITPCCLQPYMGKSHRWEKCLQRWNHTGTPRAIPADLGGSHIISRVFRTCS